MSAWQHDSPCLLCVAQLEIKAYLEAVYGMPVERVSTINYLGRKYQVPVHKVSKYNNYK